MGTYSNLFKSSSLPAPSSQDDTEKSPSSAEPTNTPDQNRSTERISERKTERSDDPSALFPVKRRTKRYSFEFYDDQIMAIKRMVYEASIAGETISQSDIVRSAVDEYLNKQK